MVDTTTKFQAKFDLFQILKEAGVSGEDTADIIYAVQNNDSLVAEVERLKELNRKYEDDITKKHYENERLKDRYESLRKDRNAEVESLKQENEKMRDALNAWQQSR